MNRRVITICFNIVSKIKLFTLNPLSTWLRVKINLKIKISFFCFFNRKTRVLKVEDITPIRNFIKIMKSYTILPHIIIYKVTKLTHRTVILWSCQILFSTRKLRSYFIFRFELSNSFTTKLAGLQMEEHLTITEPRGILLKSLDNKLIIKFLESFENWLCCFTLIKSFFWKSSGNFVLLNPIFISLSLTFSTRRPLSYRNQSNDLLRISMD